MPENTLHFSQAFLDLKYAADPLAPRCRPVARRLFAGGEPEEVRKAFGLTPEEFRRLKELPPFQDEMKQLDRAKRAAAEQGNPTTPGGR